MNIHSLPKINAKSEKRVGRGYGSGKAKTAGRGTKGRKAHGSVGLSFEGGALPLIKRLPFHRGKGRNQSFRKEVMGINVGLLEKLPKGSVVDKQSLLKNGIITKQDANRYDIKILGNGTLTKDFKVKLSVSESAKKKIEKAKGVIVVE